MALILCTKCGNSGTVPDPLNPEILVECLECRGTGKIETDWVGTINKLRFLIDEVEPIIKEHTTKIDSLTTEIADIKDKVNDIKEKVDEIKAKVDTL